MEEVDNIVLLNLKEIGIDLDDVKSLGDLKAEQVYSATLQCLLAIDSKKVEHLPLSLPRGMSVKVNTTSDLATIIKAVGYKNELSYHQLLYPTASDSRKLLMWLFDSMPKKTIKVTSTDGPVETVAIDDAISRELTFLLQDSWTPSFAASSNRAKQYYSDTYSISTCDLVYPSKGRKLKTTPGLETFYSKYLPFVTRQPPHKQEVAPSIFETNLSVTSEQAERENEWNTKGLGSNLNPMAYNKKKFDNIARMMAGILRNNLNSIEAENGQKLSDALNNMLQQDGSKSNLSQMGRKIKYTTEDDKVDVNEMTKLTEEELQKKREEEILELQTELSKYQNAREELDKEIKSMQAQIKQIEIMIGEQSLETEKLERDYKLKKKTFDLLANPEKNMLQLQELNAQFSGKLIELAKEWEKHRLPLLEQIRQLRSQIANSKDETKEKLAKIKEIRDQMKDLATEVHAKDEKYGEMLETYNKLPKDITRTHYTNRILDIVKNVKKQKVEISKILIDTRSSQKEINSVSDTLNRTYSLVDELVFQEAKKDTNAKEVYKTLVGLHDNFTKLTSKVEEIGQTRNANLNLEAKIDQVQERTNALNIERVEQDLKEIKAENKSLIEKIQQQKQ